MIVKPTTIFTYRLEKKLKDDFDNFCRTNNTTPSAALRAFMKKVVDKQKLSVNKIEKTVEIQDFAEKPPFLVKMGYFQLEIAQKNGYLVDISTNSLIMPFLRHKKAVEVMKEMSEIEFKAFRMLKLSKPNSILSLNHAIASSFKEKGLSDNNLMTQLLVDIIFISNEIQVTKHSNTNFLDLIK